MTDFDPQTVLILQNRLADAQRNIEENTRVREQHMQLARNAAKAFATNRALARDLRHFLRQADPENAARYEDGGVPAAADKTRDELLDGLRELADYLETHPEIPTPSVLSTDGVTVQIFPGTGRGPDADAAVDEVAAAMGETACRPDPRSHYRAIRKFGAWVRLEAVATATSNLDWKPGDPLPPGLPPEVVAKYAPEPAADDDVPGEVIEEFRRAGEPTDPCGAKAPHTGFLCEREIGHDGDHRGNNIVWPRVAPLARRCNARTQAGGVTFRCVRAAGHDDVYADAADLTMLRHFNRVVGEWDDRVDQDAPDETALDKTIEECWRGSEPEAEAAEPSAAEAGAREATARLARRCRATRPGGDGTILGCVRVRGHDEPQHADYDPARSAHFSSICGEWNDEPADRGAEVLDERIESVHGAEVEAS